MEKFLNRLEKKIGRFAIRDLINYFIIIYIASTVLGLFSPYFYYRFLALDWSLVFQGQVWRILTFICEPHSMQGILNIIFFIFTISIYYLLGHSLENAWGAFRFNLFFFSGIFLTILASLIYYFATGGIFATGIGYLYQSMFFAFAVLFPEMQFMIYGILPVKVKYLALIDAVLLIANMISYIRVGFYVGVIAIVVAMLNFLIFWRMYRKSHGMTIKQVKRRKDFQRKTAPQMSPRQARHVCAICGRTSETNPELEFRYCTKCAGNYEYCQDHLFTHEHKQ